MPIAAMYAHNLPITLFIAYHPWPFRHALTVLSTIAAAGGVLVQIGLSER